MKNFFKESLSSDEWIVSEDGFNSAKMNCYESIFSLGNGYMGSRGILEEIPYDCSPGTYIAGVYDKSISQVAELVNVPNPVDLRMTAEGEKIDIKGMYLHKHKRALDMKKGLLMRHTVLANSRKERFDYKSLRFISSADRHVGVMRIWITPVDAPAIITVQDNINVSVRNRGVLTEGRKKHFQIYEVRNEKSVNYISAKTQDTRISLACASHLIVNHGNREYPAPDQSFDIRLKKGESLMLTKVFQVRTSRHVSQRRLRDTTIRALRRSVRSGFSNLLRYHTDTFGGFWKNSDIIIDGDSDAQKSLRFNIYHMIIAANFSDKDVSIGARTLSGEGYRGHIFWDTEIYLLPFYIYNFPEVAKNLLMYRYNRLDAARNIAKQKGYKGALFPWESADKGIDETPQWHKDLDGSIIKITTQEYEQHIVGDIAYAIWHYYEATADDQFMNNYGAEMLFETARFWASRVMENKKRKRFEIHHVMGPDEFHGNVNNNAYTNMLAKWNLHIAHKLYKCMKIKYGNRLSVIAKNIALKEKEVSRWHDVGTKIYFPIAKKAKVIESFEGYFKKLYTPITRYDKNFMPEFPPNLPLTKLEKTQAVKQLDAVMLLYLLPDYFDKQTIQNTVAYYEKRTVHKSSLSAAINAVINLRSGNATRAYQYFLYALNTDIKMTQSNVAEGIHAGALGGSWQAVVNGFGGLRMRKEHLSLNPLLPGYWQSLSFSIKWRGSIIDIHIRENKLSLLLKSAKGNKPVEVEVYGKFHTISPGKPVTIIKRGDKE